jgi:hypothetical protein
LTAIRIAENDRPRKNPGRIVLKAHGPNFGNGYTSTHGFNPGGPENYRKGELNWDFSTKKKMFYG